MKNISCLVGAGLLALTLSVQAATDPFADGVVARQAGRNADAITAFTQVIADQPNQADAYWQRGLARAAAGDLAAAQTDCDRAVQLAPSQAQAWNARGSVRFQQKDYAGAIADGIRATELDANLADAYFNLGLAYGAKGDRGQALAQFTRAAELQPDNPAYAQARQVAEWQQKKGGAAIGLLGGVLGLLQEQVNKNPQNFGKDFGKVLGGFGALMKAAQAAKKPIAESAPAASPPAANLPPVPAPATPAAAAPPPPASATAAQPSAPLAPAPAVGTQPSAPASTVAVAAPRAAPTQQEEEAAIRQTIDKLCGALEAKDAAKAAGCFSADVRDAYQKQLEDAKDQLPGLAGPLKAGRVGAVSPEFRSETRGTMRTAELTTKQDGQETKIELIKLQGQWWFKTL